MLSSLTARSLLRSSLAEWGQRAGESGVSLPPGEEASERRARGAETQATPRLGDPSTKSAFRSPPRANPRPLPAAGPPPDPPPRGLAAAPGRAEQTAGLGGHVQGRLSGGSKGPACHQPVTVQGSFDRTSRTGLGPCPCGPGCQPAALRVARARSAQCGRQELGGPSRRWSIFRLNKHRSAA